MEGGSIDVNGRGTLLTTEDACSTKNARRGIRISAAGFKNGAARQSRREKYNLARQGHRGDDTHGHVDDLCRFVNRRTVVLVREKNRHDANYKPLEENWDACAERAWKMASKLDVVALPMPAPLHFDGVRLPASYANFYICNAAFWCRRFNDPNDLVALGVLGELFPARRWSESTPWIWCGALERCIA